jgi:hypothetical protein
VDAREQSSRRITLLSTVSVGEQAAADAISTQLPDEEGGFTVLFGTTQYDLGRLGRALRSAGHHRVVGAATSRAIGPAGFLKEGVTGFHLPAGRFKVADALIEDVGSFGLPDARQVVQTLLRRLHEGTQPRQPHLFAMLLVDAEPRCEERLVAALATELGGVPLVGGSAGDVYFNPSGQNTTAARVLHQGRAVRAGAVFCIVASQDPVLALSHHNFVAGRRRLVVTDADPDRRLVHEIDGRSALKVYAAACGLKSVPKDARAFSSYPLMIKAGGQYFARGMQRIYEGGSIEFACAIEPGLVVRVAQPEDMLERLTQTFDGLNEALGVPELVIGFDCAARTAYMERHDLAEAISGVFAKQQVIGFSTLGEQFNTIHVNNSLTCLGIAAAK